jgi:hypothetical protein
MSELGLAGAVYVSVAAPERAPWHLEKIPLVWRLLGLLAWSVVAGVVLQFAGTVSGLR